MDDMQTNGHVQLGGHRRGGSRRHSWVRAWGAVLTVVAVAALLSGCAGGSYDGAGTPDPTVVVDPTAPVDEPAPVDEAEVSDTDSPDTGNESVPVGGESGRSASSDTAAKSGGFQVGDSFEDTCTIAWPTAPTRSNQGTQIRTTCSGVKMRDYQFVDILVLDPDLDVSPSRSTVLVSGEVVDIAQSELGFKTLVVVADKAEVR